MLNWISQHHAVLSVFINCGMLLIWLVYAQLMYFGFRRQRRPRIIINRGRKKGVDALCIISNMSTESIFIEYIIAELETSRGTITMDVTDLDREHSEGGETDDGAGGRKKRRTLTPGLVDESTRQGPLESGGFLHIGTFSNLIKRLASQEGIEMQDHRPKGELRFRCLTIHLIAIHGSEDRPIGAKRSFDLNLGEDESRYTLTPLDWDTQRLASLWQRRRLRKMVEEMSKSNYSSSTTIRLEE